MRARNTIQDSRRGPRTSDGLLATAGVTRYCWRSNCRPQPSMTLPALGLVALLGARAAAAAGVDGGTCNATTAYCYVRPLFLSVGLSLAGPTPEDFLGPLGTRLGWPTLARSRTHALTAVPADDGRAGQQGEPHHHSDHQRLSMLRRLP
jgi:hypothetical protein